MMAVAVFAKEESLPSGEHEKPEDFVRTLTALADYCRSQGFEFSEMAIQPLLDVVSNGRSYAFFENELKEIRSRIIDELRIPRFFFIPREKVPYFERRDDNENVIPPFSPEVQKKFGKLAARDIDEAGKCYAAGRNTASVFHLMRVIEVGLDDIQKRLKVKTKSPNWDIIIGALQKEADARVGKNPRWRKAHRFYSDALSQLRNIKDAWRNPVMHVIEWHDEESAAGIYAHTKAFMQRLAKGIR